MKLTTGKFRASYAQVFKQNEKGKFSLAMLFDKKDKCLVDLKKAADQAAAAKWGSDKTKWPKKLSMPFHDGDAESDHEAYKGKIFIRASTKHKPQVVDRDLNPIIEASDFYSGCFARASVTAFAYDVDGNKGVSFYLGNIQKLGDGDSMSGGSKASDDFSIVDEDESEAEDYSDI